MLFSNDDIVDRIAKQMAIKNLTVNGLAEEVGISSSSLSRYLLKRYKLTIVCWMHCCSSKLTVMIWFSKRATGYC